MAPHNSNARGAEAGLLTLKDPDNAGSISVGSRMVSSISLVTGAAGETRSLKDPAQAGQTIVLCLKTDGGGDCVVTGESAINQAGNTVMTFGDAGDTAYLVAVEDGADKEWRVVINDGITLS